MYKISKRFDFSASHRLEGLPADHQCARLHGHNYSLTVHLQSDELNKVGFVKDYGELSEIKHFLDEHFEHRHLNDVVSFNPTAENLAKWFYDYLKPQMLQITAITIKETEKTEATYQPADLARIPRTDRL